jgi:NADP-dependent 3-hydroxy acid dehydrogenase YdfG
MHVGEKMKIAITGHTRGIGKAISDKFNSVNYEVLGFSKSNGFDISKEQDRNTIFNMSKDADIFVNNAYDPEGQTDLLNRFIGAWEGTGKTIINMSSKLSICPPEFLPGYEQYIQVKKQQNKIIEDRATVDSPRILNILAGLVDTDMASMFNSAKMSPDDIANLIYVILQMGNKISVQQLVIDVPNLDWKTIKVN